jgi:hypothetical protein
MNTPTPIDDSPWHAGEQALQRSANVLERMDMIGRKVVRDYLLEQHQGFYPLLPFMVLGAVDGQGDVWASLRAGEPGFVQIEDARHLRLDLQTDPADPAQAGLTQGAALGLLGIDLLTRRRNRLNGRLQRVDQQGLSVTVEQSFGNCPQYIHQRQFAFARDPAGLGAGEVQWLSELDAEARRLISSAATLFVATYVDVPQGGRQVDVSHRGGKPGFVRLNADGSLTVPDFMGNQFFNTLGNMQLNPRAGLLFIDFETGDMLQMSGAARVDLDSPDIAAFAGAERLWHFIPQRSVRRRDASPLRWLTLPGGLSPSVGPTGSWA